MKLPTLLVLLCAACAASAQPPQGQGEQSGRAREHRRPPQEAFDACKGKKDGDAAQGKGPRGETMSGTCRLVLIPTRAADEGRPERPRQ
ncbi:MAG: hypothetical protein V4582_16720 [Pseudomonadota bacterium]